MAVVIWWLVLGVASYLAVPLLRPIFISQVVVNYQGKPVPTGLGLAFILPFSLVLVGHLQEFSEASAFTVLVLFFALLGQLDDSLGTNSKKGIRGHFGRLELSTGGLKALGGLAISFVLVRSPATYPFEWILNSLLIALAANLINLLDLRPGRAGKAFLFFGFLLLLFSQSSLLPIQWCMASVLGYLPWDLREACIMGDTGSNGLGAVLGLGIVLTGSLRVKLAILLLLIALNLLSERYSFSAFIDSNRLLQFLDRLGR